MIIVTGAAGFIGSAMVARLNAEGHRNLVLVDDFEARPDKLPNLAGKQYLAQVPREEFFDWIATAPEPLEAVIHLGARTDTAEQDVAIFDHLNLEYSKRIWALCVAQQVPLIYASSAATYGDGKLGFDDATDTLPLLQPLNPYGQSKHQFDQWALAQADKPFFWAGLKFFNVYGPNEYHKGRMASVVYHGYHQIRQAGLIKLFRSHRLDYADGGQRRDFIYVKDVVDVIHWLLTTRQHSGIFNLGTGQAETFNALAQGIFGALDLEPAIEYIPMPEDIRDAYQYYTQANMDRLRAAGYRKPFTSLAEGIDDYVRHYLLANSQY